MRAASSGASRPLSAASTASLRTAVMRTLIETEPRLRASSSPRQAFTEALGTRKTPKTIYSLARTIFINGD